MNKKEFIKPDVQITLFDSRDVISTSPIKLPIDTDLYGLSVDKELQID